MTEGLIDRFNKIEIKTIIYHELGHVKLRHGKLILSLTFAVAVAVSALMFYTRQVMLANGANISWSSQSVKFLNIKLMHTLLIKQMRKNYIFIHNDDDTHTNKRSEWHDTHPSLQKRILKAIFRIISSR